MCFRLNLYFSGKKASSPGDLISQLEGFDFPASQDTETFARELQRRLPQKRTGLSVSHLNFCESSLLQSLLIWNSY